MPILPTLAAAVTTLTSSGVFGNTETVTIGGKVYTFQTALTNVDGNVLIGANQTASHLNLLNACNLTGSGAQGAGTAYATLMTINQQVIATSSTGTTTVFGARIKGGTGNQIATTKTVVNATFTSTVMASGSGDASALLNLIRTESQSKADELQALNLILNF